MFEEQYMTPTEPRVPKGPRCAQSPPSLQTLSQRTGDEFLCKAGVAGELLARDKERSPVKKGDKGSSRLPTALDRGTCCPRDGRRGEAGQGHLGH